MNLLFAQVAWEQYQWWLDEQADDLPRLNRLLRECMRQPFTGIGKPEPLKGEMKGWWSRRITDEHRLVYRVRGSGGEQTLEVAQCRYHY